MIDFRTYYIRKHGFWPGAPGDKYNEIFVDLCNDFADYVDEAILERKIPTRYDQR